jgi:putative membrane protein
MQIVALILGILLAAAAGGLVIWIVSKLGLGLSVQGFVPAMIAAIVIAVVGGIIAWILEIVGIRIGGGILGAIINLVIAAIVLLLSGKLFKGLQVNGFGGAIVGAIGIGVVTWLINWVLGLFLG